MRTVCFSFSVAFLFSCAAAVAPPVPVLPPAAAPTCADACANAWDRLHCDFAAPVTSPYGDTTDCNQRCEAHETWSVGSFHIQCVVSALRCEDIDRCW